MKINIPMQRKNMITTPQRIRKFAMSKVMTVIILMRGPMVRVFSNIRMVLPQMSAATNPQKY